MPAGQTFSFSNAAVSYLLLVIFLRKGLTKCIQESFAGGHG